jgi:hypothetical protein
MDLNAQLAMEEPVKLVREELQTLWAEMKQGFAATMSSLTCSKHVSGFTQDTTTMTSTPISHSAPASMTWPPLSRTGNGGLRNTLSSTPCRSSSRGRVNKFGEFYQNSTDSVPTEFQNRRFLLFTYSKYLKK